jgi:phospholipid/cholesterol/gamma-HCH transport system permease protein
MASQEAYVATQSQSMTRIDADLTQGRLRVRGELSGAAGAELYSVVQTAVTARPAEVVIDLSAVLRMDSLGGAWLSRTTALLRQAGIVFRLEGAQGQVRDFLRLIGPTLSTSPPLLPRQPGFFETLGDAVFAAVAEGREVLGLFVETVYWACLAPFVGKGLRWRSLVEELATIGVRATFIVVLMNFLLGLVIALMSAAQLRQFGAEIFVADLVAIAFARELASMMTAVIVSARSGSAITAELATMVVQEEIDALKSMGLNTAQFLVAPKFWAMLLAMPALTVLAMFAGTLGGMEMGVLHLGIDVHTWVRETLSWVSVRDVMQGLTKSLVFGATIVFMGCHNGLRVRGGAQGVGTATTRAVVMDVVLIVIWDMLFALLFEFVV